MPGAIKPLICFSVCVRKIPEVGTFFKIFLLPSFTVEYALLEIILVN